MIPRSARVGVLMGGLSSEYAISMKSGQAVSRALRSRGWDVVDIVVDRNLPQRLCEDPIDVAWIALHGEVGEDGCVQGLLEVMGVPYTGSGVMASALAMDKDVTKRLLAGVDGIVLARDWPLEASDELPVDLALPVVVKPAVGGSSCGIAKVEQREDLVGAVQRAFEHAPKVLVEQYIEGREITVAVFNDVALSVVEVIPDTGFFGFEEKYTKGRTQYVVPAEISAEATRRAQAAAVEAYRAVGCRGLARVDFLVSEHDVPIFLEVNTIPGMTATSLAPMAAAESGIAFEELVEKILLQAVCAQQPDSSS